jgi:hypothetical protein
MFDRDDQQLVSAQLHPLLTWVRPTSGPHQELILWADSLRYEPQAVLYRVENSTQ